MAKGLDAGEEEVGAAPYRGERRQPFDYFPDRPLRDFELQRPVLRADERITLVAELVKSPIIDPHVLRKLELADEAGATDEGSDPSFHTVLGHALGQWRAIGAATANHLPPIHVRGRVTRIHAPDVGAEWNGIPVRVHFLVVEVVVSLHVGPERGVVLVRRQDQRSTAAP